MKERYSMASAYGGVWAIDIGSNSLKALQLTDINGVVEVIGFDNIQHEKILSGSGIKAAEKDELIALSLRQFVSQNNIRKNDIIISVPSQNSFARFVSLPPVEPKRIPEIVNFEAAQQIPFDINDVQWDWQLMTEEDDPEIKVGLFAIKNEVVTSELEHLGGENLRVNYVQMAPMALYNYVFFDRPELMRSGNQATVILNIGADHTDLVVCTGTTVWQRCIPMGGNAFTKAIAEAFKLNFEKAEKLKRTAAMSKYARQIFQAMRPVFTDLASEIQRSLGFYASSNSEMKLSRIIASGGGTKMRGLLKYLEQTLQIPIERPDSFKKLVMGSDVSAAKFHENVGDFGVVYGLAVQVLGLGRIESNLLPSSVARSMMWASKAKYFITTACILLFVSLLSLGRTVFVDQASYNKNESIRKKISSVIKSASQSNRKLKNEEDKSDGYKSTIEKGFEPFKYRNIIPLLHQTIISVLPNETNNSEQSNLYKAFAIGDVGTVLKVPRKERKQIFVTNISVRFGDDVEVLDFSGVDIGGSGLSEKEAALNAAAELAAMEEAILGMQGGSRKKSKLRQGSKKKKKKKGDSAEGEVESGPGFVVTVAGYSPYGNIGELMDPAGVGDDKKKWGVITRLLHLDDIVDGNSPFKLYQRTKVKHFKLETGEVDLEADMPSGIGVIGNRLGNGKTVPRNKGGQVLIDPMTKEIISKIAELDEKGREKVDRAGNVVYEINDHWFVLDIKLIWKDAPEKEEDI